MINNLHVMDFFTCDKMLKCDKTLNTLSGVISISDPITTSVSMFDVDSKVFSNKPLDVPANLHKTKHLNLIFHDVDKTDMDGIFIFPSISDIEKAIEFSTSLDFNKTIFIHCHAGVCRSSAIAIAISLNKTKDIKESFRSVLKHNKSILPNSLIIELTDELLNFKGELIAFNEKFCSSRIKCRMKNL